MANGEWRMANGEWRMANGELCISWIEEVPGVHSQGTSRDELIDNLRDVISVAIGVNREDARKAAGAACEGVAIQR